MMEEFKVRGFLPKKTKQAELEIKGYLVLYNEQRKHTSLNRLTPDQVYHSRQRFKD
jgi:hypothetical protein